MLKKNCIDIVLASYNGGTYIAEQIKSIQRCEGYDLLVRKLIVSDDNSVDETTKILAEFSDPKIQLCVNDGNRGPVGNFENGLKRSSAEFVMFSDQDDSWSSSKLVSFYEKAIQLDDEKAGAVYSDLQLVDENLKSLGKTFLQNENIPISWGCRLSNLFLQNVAPGCAMLINRKCVERIVPFSGESVLMHDWWALLFAALNRNVITIDVTLTNYRQHENNVIGASRAVSLKTLGRKLTESRDNFKKSILQLNYFSTVLTDEERLWVVEKDLQRLVFLSKLESKPFSARLVFAIANQPFKSTMVRDLITRLFIIWGK